MLCSGCGSNIPFGGQVCPFCQRDKSSDQAATVWGFIGLAIGGFLGNAISGFGGMIVGGLVGAFIVVAISMAGKNHSAKKPPQVRIEQSKSGWAPPPPRRPSTARPASVVATTEEDGPEKRLRRLGDLRSQGLLSEQEYDDQRKVIISGL